MNSILASNQISRNAEYGLISELCSHLDNDKDLSDTIKIYLQADPDYADIQKII